MSTFPRQRFPAHATGETRPQRLLLSRAFLWKPMFAQCFGAAIGVAALVAIADGSHARSGMAAVGGDRTAMLAAALAGLGGTLIAWFGAPSRKTT